jgi:hypothetical protein
MARPDPDELRSALSAIAGDAIQTNDALCRGVGAQLTNLPITHARARLRGLRRMLSIELTLADGTMLTARKYARAAGPLAALCRKHAGEPECAPNSSPARRLAPMARLAFAWAAARALEGGRLVRVLSFEIYDSAGNVGFEVELDDGSLIEAAALGHVTGPAADLCLMAGANPTAATPGHLRRRRG